MKDGKKHGKGVLYYRNRKQVAFKGTFKEDEVSEGTLYDLDGTVICEGEWSNGLCGLTDFYDVYYSNSIMEEQDYKVLLGDEYDDYASMKELLSDTELTMEEDASGSGQADLGRVRKQTKYRAARRAARYLLFCSGQTGQPFCSRRDCLMSQSF